MQNIIKLSKIFLILAFSVQAHAGLKLVPQSAPTQNDAVIKFALESTPESTMNAASVANLAGLVGVTANASKGYVLNFKFTNLTSCDAEDLKKMAHIVSPKTVKQLSVEVEHDSEKTSELWHLFEAEKVYIKYKTVQTLDALKNQVKDLGSRTQSIQLECPSYKGVIRLEDLRTNTLSWVTCSVSNQHSCTTIQTEDGGINMVVNVQPEDLVRNIFSPDGLSKHQAWGAFLDQNVADSLPLPYFAVPMEDIDHLKLFIKCYRDQFTAVSIAEKTAYDPKQKKLEINHAMFCALLASDQWTDVLKRTLNEESTLTLQNNGLNIENWENFLKLPYSVRKKEDGNCSVSIEKKEDAYVFCLGLTQQEVARKLAHLNDTEKTALINELGPWSADSLNKMGVNVKQLRKDQAIAGKNIVAESDGWNIFGGMFGRKRHKEA